MEETAAAPAEPGAAADTGETIESWTAELRANAGLEEPGDAGDQPAPPAPKTTEPPAPKRPPVAAAHDAFRQRQAARRERENGELAQTRDRLRQLTEVVAEAIGIDPAEFEGGAGGERKAPAKEDAEPEFLRDPKAWHEWNRRQLERSVAEKVDPIIARQQAEERQAAQQQRVQQAQRAVFEDIRRSEQEYMQTEEGQGYEERLEEYKDIYRYAMTEVVGLSPQTANALMMGQFRTTLGIAEREGLNPAALADRMMVAHDFIARAMASAFGGDEEEPAAAAPPAAPSRPTAPPRAREELAGLRAAAGAPEANSPGAQSSTSPRGGDDLMSQARSGRLHAEGLRGALQRRGYEGTDLKRGVMDFLGALDGKK